MVSIDVTIPEKLAEFVSTQARASGHGSAGDYVRALIEAEQRRQGQLESAVLEALDSGEATPLTQADWDGARSEFRRRVAERNA